MISGPDSVLVAREEYEKMKEDSVFLGCLLDSGVKDWVWYDEAIDLYEQRKKNKVQ